MRDEDKTKEQLISELVEMRQRVAELETAATERKRAEKALKKSEERHRYFVEQTGEGFYRIESEQPIPIDAPEDEQIKLMYQFMYVAECNDIFARMYGYPSAEAFVGTRFIKLHGRPDVPENIEALKAFIRNNYMVIDAETREVDKDGNEVYFLNNAVGIVEKGHLVAVWGTQRDITERKRAEEELRRRNQELAVLNAIAATVSQSLDLHEILHDSLDKVLEVIGVEAGSIYLIDQVAGELVHWVYRGLSEEFAQAVDRVRLDESTFTGRVALSGESVVVEDLSAEAPHRTLIEVQQEGLRAFASVPLKAKGKVLGVMNVTSHVYHRFTPEDVALLEAIGNHIGVAIENAQLYEQATRHVKALSTLHQISQELTSTLDLDQILQAIADDTIRLTGAARSLFLVINSEAQQIVLATGHGYSREYLEGLTFEEFEAGLSGWVRREGKPALVPDAQADPRQTGIALEHAKQLGTRSLAIAPLWIKGEVVGTLTAVGTAETPPFTEETLELVVMLANQAAIAIENAQLYQTERKRRRVADTLRQVATVLSSTLDLRQVLDLILEHLAQVVPYDSASVMLVSDDTLGVVAARGFPDLERAMQVAIPVAEDTLFQEMLRTRQPVVLADAQKDERFLAAGGTDYVRGWIGAPLVVKGRVIGNLTVDSRQPGTYGQEEAQLVAAFADQAAIAIENARLYEETRRRAERLAVINRISRAASATLHLDALVEVVYQEVSHIFQADAFFLALYDSEANELDFRLRVDEGIREPPERRPMEAGLTATVVTTKKPLLIRDFEKEKDRLPPAKVWGTMKIPPSWLGVPMLIGDQVVGVISVQAYHPQAYGEEEQLLLSTIADQVAVAVENARLFEETRGWLAREERLNELAHALGGEMELSTLIPRLLPPVAELTGADAGTVAVLDPERQVITYPYHYNLPDALAGVEVPAGSGLAGHTMRIRRPVLLDDYREHSAALQPWVEAGVRSMLAVPLLVGDQVVGALGLFSLGEIRPFGPEAVATAEAAGRLAAVAIQRARLFEMEHQRRQEAETLREVALALTSALDRNQVIERILSQLQQVVPYDSASVQLLQGDKLVIIGGRGFPNLEEILGISFPVDGDNPNREVMRTLSPFILDDAPAAYEAFTQEPFAAMGIRSWLGVPMLIGKRPVGMITLDKCQPGFYTQEHARLAQAFAAQAAIAIENARLFEEERRRAAQLAVVNKVGRHATSTLELDQILRDVTTAIQIGFGYYNVATFLVEGEYAVLKAIAGGFAEAVKDGYRQHLSQGIVGWCITHDQTMLANDVSRDPHFVPGFLEKVVTQSELCVPIRVDGKVVGALDVQSTELNAFDEWDVRALETLSDQVALAYKNALAYGHLDEEKGRLELLYEVAAEVNRSLDLDEILARAIERITARLGGKVGYVFLVEPGTDRLQLRALSGVDVPISELNEMLDVHLGQGVVGWVAAHREAAVVDDVTQDERWLYVDELDRGIRSVMSVPLVRGEETLGALSVLHSTPGFFDEEQCRLLMAVAQQVAVAVANARLHQTVQEQAMLDSLTQVYNHGELIRRLHMAVEEGARENQPVSYIMLDIDYFKEYNDRYGHVTGDLILKAIVQAIQANIKKTDIVGRWGGEEFGIVLPRTDREQAQIVAQRIRHTLATMSLTDGKGHEVPKPTVSQGIATYPTTTSSAEELIDLADAALYRAKARGRDQVDVVCK